jgi:hypothetical protein
MDFSENDKIIVVFHPFTWFLFLNKTLMIVYTQTTVALYKKL